MAAIALLRMHAYTEEPAYHDKGEQTLELLAGSAGQYGIFAGTYGIAAQYFAEPHRQIVIIGEDETAQELYGQAIFAARFGHSVLKLTFSQAVPQNLPPALAATIPQLPAVAAQKTVAVVCSEGSCKPPAHGLEELSRLLTPNQSAA